jgi:hypothetical protein
MSGSDILTGGRLPVTLERGSNRCGNDRREVRPLNRRLMAAALFALGALTLAPSASAGTRPDPSWQDVFGNSKISSQISPSVAGCWTTTWRQAKSGWWGYWEHWQRTHWCGNGTVITYRSSLDGAAAGGTCGINHGPNTWRTFGGVGYPVVRVRTQTTFACLGGWVTGSPWMENAFNADGLSWSYDWDDG